MEDIQQEKLQLATYFRYTMGINHEWGLGVIFRLTKASEMGLLEKRHLKFSGHFVLHEVFSRLGICAIKLMGRVKVQSLMEPF